jgi:hypothetical protein
MRLTLSTAAPLVACVAGAVLLAGTSALVPTSKADHVHAHAASPADLTLGACAGGRALCGDRAGAVPPELADVETTVTDVSDCTGGRRLCGDRNAYATEAAMSWAPVDGDAVLEHPRTLGR